MRQVITYTQGSLYSLTDVSRHTKLKLEYFV